MEELSGVTVAEGWWCRQCEFFEDDDDEINETMEVCVSCGCNGAEHSRAEVVAK